MKKHIKSFILFAVLFIGFLETNGQCVFHKLFDYNLRTNFGWSVIQTSDNGYISCGALTDPLALYIVRTDECGDTLWSRMFDYSSTGADDGYSVLQLTNGNYSICGSMQDTAELVHTTYLFTIDSNGDSVSYKIIEGGYNDISIMHKKTPDGGFIIGGYNFDTTLTYSQVYLIKTDSFGNKEWQQEYGDINYNDNIKSIDHTYDGGFIIGGDYYNPATNSYDLFLLKTDSLGNQQWRKSYGGNYSDRKGYAIATSDGGYAIVGYTTYANGNVDGYIVKTDSLGTIQWEKKYGNASTIDVLINVRQLHDNTYIISGGIPDISVNPPRPRVWLLKTDPNGDTLWTKTYTYYGHSSQYKSVTHDYVEDLNICNDGGFVMTGYIINNYFPAKNDLFILKTDSMGNTCEIDTTTWQGCALIVSVEETKDSYKYSGAVLYPNPSSGYVTVKSDTGEGIDFTLYDITGTEIMHTKTLNTQTIYLKGIQQGIYIYRIITDDKQSKSGRLVIIK